MPAGKSKPPPAKPKPKKSVPLSTLKLEDADSLRSGLVEAVRAQHRPVLVVISGNEIGQRKRVEGTLVIGRDPAADLVLTDAGVSWHHALIEDRGDTFTLVDLGSTNGTSVNGKPVDEQVLAANDKIVLARTLLRFEVQDAEDAAYAELVQNMLNLDDLTGLLVRRKFDADLQVMVEAARTAGGRVGLLVMDLDGVKGINDTHGHLFGAYTIGEAGKVIGRIIEGRGIACRFGGDEYIAGFPDKDVEEAASIGEEIRAAIAAHPFEREGIALRPGISIGVAAFPESAKDPHELFQRGDEALYRAKQTGKNRVCR